MTLDAASVKAESKSMDDAWHQAEAYHFWILAQKQLYRGEAESAMRTCLHLKYYDDVIDEEIIYALIALMSCCCGFYEQTSKALMKLESMESLDLEIRRNYADLAVKIFMKYVPSDPRIIRETKKGKINDVGELINEFRKIKANVCVRTGRLIRSKDVIVKCKMCKHASIVEEEINVKMICSLCHSEIKLDR